jgi:hypothetical protein
LPFLPQKKKGMRYKMITQGEAESRGLRGTVYWKELVEKIDSLLCVIAAGAAGKFNNRIDVNPIYSLLVVEAYSGEWEVTNMGSGDSSNDTIRFGLRTPLQALPENEWSAWSKVPPVKRSVHHGWDYRLHFHCYFCDHVIEEIGLGKPPVKEAAAHLQEAHTSRPCWWPAEESPYDQY